MKLAIVAKMLLSATMFNGTNANLLKDIDEMDLELSFLEQSFQQQLDQTKYTWGMTELLGRQTIFLCGLNDPEWWSKPQTVYSPPCVRNHGHEDIMVQMVEDQKLLIESNSRALREYASSKSSSANFGLDIFEVGGISGGSERSSSQMSKAENEEARKYQYILAAVGYQRVSPGQEVCITFAHRFRPRARERECGSHDNYQITYRWTVKEDYVNYNYAYLSIVAYGRPANSGFRFTHNFCEYMNDNFIYKEFYWDGRVLNDPQLHDERGVCNIEGCNYPYADPAKRRERFKSYLQYGSCKMM